jgi:hypothetical protein
MSQKIDLTVKFLKHEIESGGSVYYTISVTDISTRETWLLRERYSTLRDVHAKLESQVDGSLPSFPSRKFFGNTDKSFILKRQKELETYFNILLKHKNLDEIPAIKYFLYDRKIE